jgi:DNA-binding transcriptional ArsR family regulator
MFDAASFDPVRFAATAAAAARLLKSLANEKRLMIMCQLSGGEMTVGALLPRVGLSQSALSQHLAVLRSDGLVATRRAGQTIHYRICDPAAAQLMTTLAAIFCPDDVESPHD